MILEISVKRLQEYGMTKYALFKDNKKRETSPTRPQQVTSQKSTAPARSKWAARRSDWRCRVVSMMTMIDNDDDDFISLRLLAGCERTFSHYSTA